MIAGPYKVCHLYLVINGGKGKETEQLMTNIIILSPSPPLNIDGI